MRRTLRILPGLWSGKTATVIATGPSLTSAQCMAAFKLGMTIAVNDAYTLFPGATMLYACDAKWWDWHDGARDYLGAKVTAAADAADKYDLFHLPCRKGPNFSTNPDYTTCGGSSAFQAANLAMLLGAERILLLGVDGKPRADGQKHFFGEHPDQSVPNYAVHIAAWESAAKSLPAGVSVINCAPGSAIDCLPRRDIFELS